jgi:hypothetical protein
MHYFITEVLFEIGCYLVLVLGVAVGFDGEDDGGMMGL